MKVMASDFASAMDPMKEVAEALLKITSLTTKERLAAAKTIANEPYHVQMLLMTPENERASMVRDILGINSD